MVRVSAEDFWRAYREEVRRRCAYPALASDPTWTKNVAIAAADATANLLGLRADEELRLDRMMFEQRREGISFDWDLRVAFEHENQPGLWVDELCKLCHVVADLRVLVGYFGAGQGSDFEKELAQRINLMGERMTRVPSAAWLFVFGPRDSAKDKNQPWIAWSLAPGSLVLTRLADDRPLYPQEAAATNKRIGPGSGH